MPGWEEQLNRFEMIYPWGTARRLNAYSDYFRKRFGQRVQKITIDAGFSCPNRDGTCGRGGCTFCDNKAFKPSYNDPGKSITQQIREGMNFHRVRYRKVDRFLAYFQAYSNTYGELKRIRELCDEAISVPGIVGIVLGTRPDCVDEEKLDYFRELSGKVYVVVEYGIESLLDRTLRRVNRGHDVESTLWAIRETSGRGIRTGGHMMIGLPGESRDDFLESAMQISQMPLDNIKYHQLQLIRGTPMAGEYREKPGDFMQFTLNEYLHLMMEIVELLHPEQIIERIAGEVTPGMAIHPGWGIRYDAVIREFEEILERYDSWQGKRYQPSTP